MDPKPLVVANWKACKTIPEALEWLENFQSKAKTKEADLRKVEVVVCPPFTALEPMRLKIKNQQLKIGLGAQDVSPFPDGPYTGEVTARMLADLVDYVLIGHSERKKDFGENVKTSGQKMNLAQKVGITPILCVANFDEIPKEPGNHFHLLYEPAAAISQKGVYRPENPENAQKNLAEWKSNFKNVNKFLYGGSVNPTNVAQFLAQPAIDGVVVGNASLDPNVFWELINHVLP